MSERTADLERALADPNVQKYLAMLRRAEGTEGARHADPYRVAGGGKTILPDLSTYRTVPWDFTQTDGKRNTSTAAGAYQFLKGTWEDVSGKLGLTDFTPRSQDLAALELMRRNGSLADVLAGDFASAVNKDGRTWASLPSSPYKQNRRSMGFVSEALGVPIGSPEAPALPAHAYALADGRVAVGSTPGERSKLSEIHSDPNLTVGQRTRLTDVLARVPQQAPNERNLFGDDLPTHLDDDLRRLIDMA